MKRVLKRIAAIALAMVIGTTVAQHVTNVDVLAKGNGLSKVTIKSVKSVNSRAIKITWKKVQGAKKYQIYRANKKNGEYKLVKTTKKTIFKNTGLKAGKKYYYMVRAVKGKKKGTFSNKKSGMTLCNFNNTYWFMSFGQSLGAYYTARFCEDGTFLALHHGTMNFCNGTYKYKNNKLTICIPASGNGDVVFKQKGSHFQSAKKYPMQVGEDYCEIIPTDGEFFEENYNGK